MAHTIQSGANTIHLIEALLQTKYCPQHKTGSPWRSTYCSGGVRALTEGGIQLVRPQPRAKTFAYRKDEARHVIAGAAGHKVLYRY